MDASFLQSNFLGGEWAPSAQGRVDLPAYRTAMNVCLNGLPIEVGAWTRRPGFAYATMTRGGLPGRVISFDFNQANPYNIEFTDGYLRFLAGLVLSSTNDGKTISSISAANPAKVATALAHGWTGTVQVQFQQLGVNNPLLQNRVFIGTVTSTTEFTITDSITGATIDGSTLGSFVSGNVSRIQEVVTPYVGGTWGTVRLVQITKEANVVGGALLHTAFKPQYLNVATQPTSTAYAQFTLAAAVFKDGPYFDEVPGGTLATPSIKTGNTTITLSFNAYDATRSYAVGDYVTSASVNYKSLIDANLNNTPASVPTAWVVVTAADAINGATHGFLGSDVGRMVRLLSAPPLWLAGTTYAANDVVAYGTPEVYWSALVGSNTGHIPGTDIVNWTLATNAARWTWGKITSLSNIIDRALAGSASIGNMTGGGNLAATFDGIQIQASAASSTLAFTGSVNPNDVITLSSYVGKNYSSASDQKISQAVVYPSSDIGFTTSSINDRFRGASSFVLTSLTLNLRGKASAPASASDGTLIGTSGNIANTTGLVLIPSTDATTQWKYVWIEELVVLTVPSYISPTSTYTATSAIAELSLFNPPGSGTSQGFILQILGDPLLYTSAIRVWRMGLFSDTSGYPAVGTFHEGRLWLSGLIGNRIDGSVAGDDPFLFSPTEPDLTVTDDNAISYTFKSPDVNPIFAMTPDQQGIICHTQAGEWLVQASALNSPLTPTNIQAHRVTKLGSENIEPRRAEHTILFVQKFARKVIEYFADVFSGKFTAPNLSKFAKHLMKSGIREIAYQQELAPILWSRMGDGSLLGCTYQRDSLISSQGPTAMGWHRHTLGSGRVVESITTGPSHNGDLTTLAIVSNDTTTNLRHVELLTDIPDDTLSLADAWHLDDAVTPSSTQNVTVGGQLCLQMNGLWHLNSATVQVFAGGLSCGSFLVTNGTINVPYGSAGGLFTAAFVSGYVGTMPIVVGFQYNSDGQIVRPIAREESGARNGPGFGKRKRSQAYAIQFLNAQSVYVGTDFATTRLNKVNFTTEPDGGAALPITQLKTGLHTTTLTDPYSFDSMLCWRVTGPYPATVVIAGQFLQTQDK